MRNRCIGIEACRGSILKEIQTILSSYGLYVNYRHLAILVDAMTSRGHLMSITRNGINRVDHGVWQEQLSKKPSKFYLMLLPWLK